MNQQRLQQTLLNSIQKNDDTGCWEWARQISNSGYGRLRIREDDGTTYLETASHAAYLAFCGEVDSKHYVTQTCGNRLCINPDHLKLELQKQYRSG